MYERLFKLLKRKKLTEADAGILLKHGHITDAKQHTLFYNYMKSAPSLDKDFAEKLYEACKPHMGKELESDETVMDAVIRYGSTAHKDEKISWLREKGLDKCNPLLPERVFWNSKATSNVTRGEMNFYREKNFVLTIPPRRHVLFEKFEDVETLRDYFTFFNIPQQPSDNIYIDKTLLTTHSEEFILQVLEYLTPSYATITGNLLQVLEYGRQDVVKLVCRLAVEQCEDVDNMIRKGLYEHLRLLHDDEVLDSATKKNFIENLKILLEIIFKKISLPEEADASWIKGKREEILPDGLLKGILTTHGFKHKFYAQAMRISPHLNCRFVVPEDWEKGMMVTYCTFLPDETNRTWWPPLASKNNRAEVGGTGYVAPISIERYMERYHQVFPPPTKEQIEALRNELWTF
jgi:hypothetical protein